MTPVDRCGSSLSYRVVETVADRKDVDPLELDPLSHAIDPDSLDRLFTGHAASIDGSVGRISFRYAGYQVTVDRDGGVDVSPAGDVGSMSP